MLFLILSVKLNSKNQRVIKKLLTFLKFCKKKFKLNIKFNSLSNIKLTKKKISVLKSPHVHKTAQEHFKIENHSAFFKIKSKTHFQQLILLFKSFNYIFFDLTFKLHFEFFFKKKLKLKKDIYNLKLFNTYNNLNPNKFFILNHKLLINYIKIFDIFGEVNLIQYVK